MILSTLLKVTQSYVFVNKNPFQVWFLNSTWESSNVNWLLRTFIAQCQIKTLGLQL